MVETVEDTGDNDGVIHDFDANPSDNSCSLKKERCGIVDEKEKQTKNVNSENVAARADIGKGNVIANDHFRPC